MRATAEPANRIGGHGLSSPAWDAGPYQFGEKNRSIWDKCAASRIGVSKFRPSFDILRFLVRYSILIKLILDIGYRISDFEYRISDIG